MFEDPLFNAYVQYGSGWCAPLNWRNFDASPTLRFERIPLLGKLYTKNTLRFPSNVEYGDIVSGLPIPDSSCKGIYCSHILEHLSLNDLEAALSNTDRMLAPEGTFRLVVPDLRLYAKRYVEDNSAQGAIDFMSDTQLGVLQRRRSVKGMLVDYLGNNRHLWMWDFESLAHKLEDAGFTKIRRASFGDSEDARFAEVEEADRWFECLGINCSK